jgi:AmmeMemoRadiSam system protein A
MIESVLCSLLAVDQQQLLHVAAAAIHAGCHKPAVKPFLVAADKYSRNLQQLRASFVTLRRREELRGCRGATRATEPLVASVAHSATAAAFGDYRFLPVTADEVPELHVHISVLTEPKPMQFLTEDELLAQLRPGVDGLILRDGQAQGVFLPAVWEKLPEPDVFLEHLKLKAGLRPDHWSPTVCGERFTVESIEGELGELLTVSGTLAYNED